MRRHSAIHTVAVAAAVAGAALTAGSFAAGSAAAAAVRPATDGSNTCTAWTSSTTPPTSIRVEVTSGTPHVVTVPFETYVENVLPNEWESGWKPASLEAGAVAAKEYGWYFTMHSKAGSSNTLNGVCYDVTDTTSYQVYRANTAVASTHAAVAATWGLTLTSGGSLIETSYRATLTGASTEACGAGLASLPNTMSQWGSENCATAGLDYDAILATYYPGVQFVQAGTGAFTDMVRTKSGAGYYTLTSGGAVHPHGTAPTFGDASGQSYFAGQTAVAMALDATGNGYWILSSGGGIYAYGDAPFYGSAAGQSYFVGQTAAGLAVDPSGNGYWILSAGGGIYAYGGATFAGSAAGQSYFAGMTAVGMATDATGNGYWILSNGGGIYAYGDAPFYGSAAGQSYFAGQTAAAIAPDAAGNGYWILSKGGGIYSYGGAAFYGSAAGQGYFAGQTATSLILDASGAGYWIVSASGGVYAYGDAPFYGAA